MSLIIFENNIFQYLYCAYGRIIMWCRKIQIMYVGNLKLKKRGGVGLITIFGGKLRCGIDVILSCIYI